jgi:MFS family permease
MTPDPESTWGMNLGSKLLMRPTREVALIFMTLSVISFRDGFVYTVLQLYLKSVGYTGSFVGSFMFILGIAASALLIPFGMISDRVDRRKIMATGVTFVSVAISLVITSTDMNVLLFAACIWGIGNAMYTPCINSILADKIRPEEMEHTYTYQALLNSFFYGTSALIGWIPELLVSMGGYELSYAYRLSMVWLVPLGIASILPLTKVSKVLPSNAKRRFVLSRNKAVLKLTLTQMVIGFGAGLSIPMLSYYMSARFGVESGPIGTLNATVSFIAIPFYFLVPVIAHKLGTIKAITLPQLFSIPLLLAMSFCPSFVPAAVFFTFRQIFMNMSIPLITAFTMRVAKPEERGTVNAMTNVAWRIPNSVATQTGGYLFDVGLNIPLYGTSLIYMIYIPLFFTFFRNMDKGGGGSSTQEASQL